MSPRPSAANPAILGTTSGAGAEITALNAAKHALERAMTELEHRVEQRTRELNTANDTLRCEVDRRHLLEKRLVAMLENEQRSMGQDLHDNIGSQLSGVELLCEAMLRQGRKAPVQRGVRTIARLIRKTLEDTRRIAHSMAPVPSCAHGLTLSLRALARRTRTTTGCHCTLRSCGAQIVDPSVALHLYRITQEAVANAVRHGAARRIAIVLNSNGPRVRLLIRDDGCGIAEKLPDDLGLGIVTMKIRANAIGGFLDVTRNGSGGTDVICSIPHRLGFSAISHPR